MEKLLISYLGTIFDSDGEPLYSGSFDWAFGALEFAVLSGLIDRDTFNRLRDEFLGFSESYDS